MYLFSEIIATTMRHMKGQVGMAFAFLSLGCASVLAQPPEPPGISPADERPQLPPLEAPEKRPEIQLPPVAPPQPDEISGALRVFVREFQLIGNTVFSAQELDELTAPYEGREITSAELESISAGKGVAATKTDNCTFATPTNSPYNWRAARTNGHGEREERPSKITCGLQPENELPYDR